MNILKKLSYHSVIGFILSLILFQQSYAQSNVPTVSNKVEPTTITPYKPGAYASVTPINYVRICQPRYPDTSEINIDSSSGTVEQLNKITQYLDGLGRPIQTVNWQSSPDKKDIISPQVYDLYGREQYMFLPYADTASNGQFKTDPFESQSNFYNSVYPNQQPAYNNEQLFYNKTIFEASPLDRVLKSFAPGNSWAGSEGSSAEHSVQVEYMVNNVYDSVQIWSIASDTLACNSSDTGINMPTSSGVYAPGELYKNITLNEKGNAVVEYKDKEGHVILRKIQVGAVTTGEAYSNWLSTYYIYDDFGLLRMILPPKSVKWLINNNWDIRAFLSSSVGGASEAIFKYEYDRKNRMIAKKEPGSGWVYMVYDKRNRLVFTQDANMRANNQWLYNLYDRLNRNVETGMINDNISFCDLQSYVNNNTGINFSSTDSISGIHVASIPANPVYNVRQPGITEYKGTQSILLATGFICQSPSAFLVHIVPGDSSNSFSAASSIVDNPIPINITKFPLKLTYYDDYTQTTKIYDNNNNSKLDIGSNTYGETLPMDASTKTINQITVSRVRILEDPSDLTKGNWLETAIFYDDMGRPIQSNMDNYKGGQNILTNRYNFANETISSYLVHNNPVGGVSSLRIKTNINYDHAGRLMNITKEINDDTATTRILVRNSYDELGKLMNKELGQKNSADTTAIENQDYSYNIRGWLKGINWDYSDNINGSKPKPTPFAQSQGRWFAMDLSYDWGFDSSGFNGNVAGERWQSSGDGAERAFGFNYDAVNRLMYGDFNQHFDNSWGKTDPNNNYTIDFSTKLGDGINATTAYDENGNIKFLQQKGLILNTSTVIDSLTYTYYNNSNKLLNVVDGDNNPATTLGDFRSSQTYMNVLGGTKSSNVIDYDYDLNGNLKKDLNKDIGDSASEGIIYNHLNLPYSIAVKNNGTITYIYDAEGNKLEKRIKDTTINNAATTIDYLGDFVYKDNVLKFFDHEEGRIRPDYDTASNSYNYSYDYFIKDHLGNVRMVLTDQYKEDIYPAATLENGSLTEDTFYYNIQSANIADTSTITGFNNNSNEYENNNGIFNPDPNINASAISQKMYRLNSSSSDKMGLGITLKVMAGDTINIFGKSYFITQDNSTDNSSYNIMPLTILNGLLSSNSALAGITKLGVFPMQLDAVPGIANGVNNFLENNPDRIPAGLSTPRAYINYIILDEHFQFVSGGVSKVGNSGVVKDHHSDLQDIVVPRNGYVYIYCSNESPVDVYFDNLQVIDSRGPLLEETHYYPFGLAMANISSHAAGYLVNNYKYAGKELQLGEFGDCNGLEEYDFGTRFYDQQLGRWTTINSFIDNICGFSMYNYLSNNPISVRSSVDLVPSGIPPQSHTLLNDYLKLEN